MKEILIYIHFSLEFLSIYIYIVLKDEKLGASVRCEMQAKQGGNKNIRIKQPSIYQKTIPEEINKKERLVQAYTNKKITPAHLK